MRALGLAQPASWIATFVFAVAWLALMLVYSPLADWLATRWVAAPPTLGAFKALQESRIKLIAGIIVAWLLGGFVEEVLLRGIILRRVAALMSGLLTVPFSAGVAICAAGAVAFALHLYQGKRAAIIIAQLSLLFGLLFVISGYNLWAVILCHGFYDTIAFIRFASGKSRYARFATQS
jgi:membrane protease YdiL (CAAX protease family)